MPFERDWLPSPAQYYPGELARYRHVNRKATALCPFHDDTRHSLSIDLDRGAFYCFACGERGRDVLDFHRKRYYLGFTDAAKQLGAWR